MRKPQSSKIEADPHSVESDDFQEFESYQPNEEGHKTVTSGSVDNYCFIPCLTFICSAKFYIMSSKL